MNQILCVAGPTASGKTKLAVALAELYDGEVVSCDSMQIYRRMDIGTAKPTKEEMRGIPHHMIDVAEPGEEFSVSRYVEQADPIVQDILSRGKRCIIAGGTGLYMDALIKGTEFAPLPQTGKRQQLEALAEEKGMEYLRSRLAAVDPDAALRCKDLRRIIRALEIYEETGETMTAHDARTKALPPKYTPCKIGLDFEDRQKLYERIDLRVEEMFKAGLLDEVRSLQLTGTAAQAIGYREPMAVLRGEMTVEEAKAAICLATRHYAKRQLTWFRRDPEIRWFYVKDFSRLLDEVRQHLTA